MVIPVLAAAFVLLTLAACIFEMIHIRSIWPKDTWKGLAVSLPILLLILLVWTN